MAVSVTEATTPKEILATYDIDSNDVLTTDNIVQTNTTTATAPDDLLGIRKDIYSEYGVDESSEAYSAAKKSYQDALNQYNTEQLELGNRAVSMSKITGIKNQHNLANQNYLNNLISNQELALEEYTTKKTNANEVFAIRESEISEKKALMAQAPEAGIKWSDSYETAVKKIAKWDKEEQERLKEEAYKDSLKAQLLAMGSSTKGLSTNELEKKLKKKNKAALEAAQEQAELEMQMKLEKHNADMANINSLIANRNGTSDEDIKTANENLIYSQLSSLPKGADGFTNPQDWKPLAEKWMDAGGSYSEFISEFSGETNEYGERKTGYINPKDL